MNKLMDRIFTWWAVATVPWCATLLLLDEYIGIVVWLAIGSMIVINNKEVLDGTIDR